VPNVKVRDYALVEDNITTLLFTNVDFQNLIALFAIELQSQAYTTSICKDLYYTAAEVAKGIEEDDEDNEDKDEDDKGDDKEDNNKTIDSGNNFDPESEEENADNMNMTG
jgi:hypothetical protein